MSAPTKNVYGTPGDTSFRKKYDREEYAAKAAAREKDHKDQKDRKLFLGKHRREPTPPLDALTTARANRLNLEENLNKTTLVPAGAGIGKRGKGAGFYCDACDLTYKDSLQWVDHLNSKQHLYATGQTGEVQRATLEEVKQRLDWLRAKKAQEEKDRAEGTGVDLKKRLEERRKIEEEERREKREKRKEKRKAAKIKGGDGIVDSVMTAAGVAIDGAEDMDADAIAMARMMGLAGGFGTTKKG
ncbi:hypothetical protein L211DRAFT_697459 [Terfezia boudieri ATCC MYA-4762]|uniref:U1-type domain-containing protein n=1 Tax=Terfezia boudieri ATCC MYA-4762 TaxID=1051890 RepID=A0A3N4LTC1_9PEZI|nr:hypothetical protein L211DRAFT_697459 [Terfezia boudieri ATCC MYA-4762]